MFRVDPEKPSKNLWFVILEHFGGPFLKLFIFFFPSKLKSETTKLKLFNVSLGEKSGFENEWSDELYKFTFS